MSTGGFRSNVDFVVRIGGEAGEGVVSAGELFAQAAARTEYHVFSYPTYPAEIKGGFSMIQIRIRDWTVYSMGSRVDYLIVFNQQAYDRTIEDLKEGGTLIYDPDEVKVAAELDGEEGPDPARHDRRPRVRGASSARTSSRSACWDTFSTSGTEVLDKLIRDRYGSKGNDVVDKNLQALAAGYEAAKTAGIASGVHLGTRSEAKIAVHDALGERGGRARRDRRRLPFRGGLSDHAGDPDLRDAHQAHADGRRPGHPDGGRDRVGIRRSSARRSAAKRSSRRRRVPGFSSWASSSTSRRCSSSPSSSSTSSAGARARGSPPRPNSPISSSPSTARRANPRGRFSLPRAWRTRFYQTIRAFNIAERFQMPVILLTDQSIGYRKATVRIPALEKIKFLDQSVPSEKIVIPDPEHVEIAVPRRSDGGGSQGVQAVQGHGGRRVADRPSGDARRPVTWRRVSSTPRRAARTTARSTTCG